MFTTKAQFLLAITNSGTDTFNNLSIVAFTPGPINRTAGVHSYTASATGGFFGAGTAGDPWLSTSNAADTLTFNNFSSSVQALGGFFFNTDVNGALLANQSIIVTATDRHWRREQDLNQCNNQHIFRLRRKRPTYERHGCRCVGHDWIRLARSQRFGLGIRRGCYHSGTGHDTNGPSGARICCRQAAESAQVVGFLRSIAGLFAKA